MLITGESGTGKELVAEAHPPQQPRAPAAPFVKVNLGGISSSLFESEMFGHVRGAFTDARADRKGRFEMAHGGTIFLDEIGDLDPPSQVKMLRVLQDRTFEVLGSSQRREVDVRVVSATNRAARRSMVARGEFREDLLYRINLIAIHLPPLRERPDDIPVLASRFLQARGAGLPARAADAERRRRARWLQAQPWPGNVRQLRQWVERAVLVEHAATGSTSTTSPSSAEPAPREPAGDALPPVGVDDDGRDRAGDDRQVAAPPRRQHQQGRRVARPEPRRALPPLREVRDRRVSLRAPRSSPTSSSCTSLFAGLGGLPVPATQPFWLIARRSSSSSLSLVVGIRPGRGEMYPASRRSPPRACA